jgi:hypothetical protein
MMARCTARRGRVNRAGAAGRPDGPAWFLADAAAIAPLYPRLPEFAALVGRLDPRGVFANAWLRERVLGGPGS